MNVHDAGRDEGYGGGRIRNATAARCGSRRRYRHGGSPVAPGCDTGVGRRAGGQPPICHCGSASGASLPSVVPPAGRPRRRVRAAQAALLDGDASALLERVRAVLCEPNRTQIVRALGAALLSVTELALVLGRSKSTTSRHVRALRETGIVLGRRRGRRVLLSLAASPALSSALATLNMVAAATEGNAD